MNTKIVLLSMVCWLSLLVAKTPAQLLNAAGEVWSEGDSQSANYIEIQVTKTNSNLIGGIASFKLNGQWITEEQTFDGEQHLLGSGIIQFDGTCSQGTRFSGWLFPGSSPGNDLVCLFFTPLQLPPCPPADAANGVLQRTAP